MRPFNFNCHVFVHDAIVSPSSPCELSAAVVPDFSAFLDQVRKVCNASGQKGPLDQRIALLESVVAESETNKELIAESLDLVTCTKNGYQLIIADLTDPLLSKEEANGLFQVLTEQFRTLPTKGGKCLFLDEAHKYSKYAPNSAT